MSYNNNYPTLNQMQWDNAYNHAHDYSANGETFFCLLEASKYQGNAAIDHLVDAATKTTAPAFVIERDLNGTHLKKTHPVVDHFYSVLSVLPDSHTSQTELSIGNQIFATAWGQLHLQKDHFTGNPHYFVGHSTLIEAELINSLIQRIREIATRASTKRKKASRIGESRNRIAQSKRLVTRYLQQQPHGLYVTRIDFEYADLEVALLSAHHHVKTLIGELEGTFKPSVVGYMWDRSHFDSIGYRHHFFLILNTQILITAEIRHSWDRITNGQGRSFEFGSYVNHPKSWGCGALYPQTCEFLLNTLQHWIKRFDAVKMRPSRDIEHFGMSKLPALTKAAIPTYGGVLPSPENLFLPVPANPFPVSIQ